MTDSGTAPAQDRTAQGHRTFEAVMGTSATDFLSHVNALAPDFGQRILEWEFADAYGRPGLDLKTRELVIIASCAALGAIGHPAVRMHVAAALRAGASPTEIREVLVQVGFAAGLPTALGALQVAAESIEAAHAKGL
jgi:4-carboxymuconolactone decarboxylase